MREKPTEIIHSVYWLWMVAPTCFGITLPSSGSVPSALGETLNWGAVNTILWMGVLCLLTWCVAIWDQTEFSVKFTVLKSVTVSQPVPPPLHQYTKTIQNLLLYAAVVLLMMGAIEPETYTVEPRFMNAPVHEQFGSRTNFPSKKCLGWWTVSWIMNTQAGNSNKLRVSARECQLLVN
jgi:hypothetical protein